MIQHVTVHLADSLPASAIEQIEYSLQHVPEDERATERRRRLHAWMDAGHGSCVLRYAGVAQMVQESLLHFDDIRYYLHAWVVMPNHVHVLIEPVDGCALNTIVASFKKFTARGIRDYLRCAGNGNRTANLPIGMNRKKANREIGDPNRKADQEIGGPGPVWHREFWDRFIRNERHYGQTVTYIHNNPVAAGLVASAEAWPWSSAGDLQ